MTLLFHCWKHSVLQRLLHFPSIIMSGVALSKENHGQSSLKRTSEVLLSTQRCRTQAYSNQASPRKKQKKKKMKMPETLGEGILLTDITALLKKNEVELSKKCLAADTPKVLPEPFTEIELEVTELSSTGEGLGLSGDGSSRIYVVPFTIPGDTVRAKVIRHVRGSEHSITDLIEVLKPSPDRDDTLIKCPYFASCSGCQFQMLPYEKQLLEKKRLIEKAYRNYSGLPSHAVPKIGVTHPSPLQYGYRTKLTPHFDGPPGMRKKNKKGERPSFEDVPPIGFTAKNRRKILDIEDCPIGTDAIRLGMNQERKRVTQEIAKYRSGATILLRQTTKRLPKPRDDSATQRSLDDDPSFNEHGEVRVIEDMQTHLHQHTYTTNNKSSITEYVGDYVFSSPANAFFQNNNSILPEVTSYIRSRILGSPSSSSTSNSCDSENNTSLIVPSSPIVNLVDAYCGSGLFTITLSSIFKRSIGIDITASSVESARQNLRLNKIPFHRANFITADASKIFNKLTLPSGSSSSSPSPSPSSPSASSHRQLLHQPSSSTSPPAPASPKTYKFEPDETAVIIDPPRKGCDIPFLRQLIRFGPARIVYMSCNVHTQARDLGFLVGGLGDEYDDDDIIINNNNNNNNNEEGLKVGKADSDSKMDSEGRTEERKIEGLYTVESIKGFDFFPQTSHVEVVAILQKKKMRK